MASPTVMEARRNKAKKAILSAVKADYKRMIELEYDADTLLRNINYAAKGLACDMAMLVELVCELRDAGELLYDETTQTLTLERDANGISVDEFMSVVEPARVETLPYEKSILDVLAKASTAMNTFQIGEKVLGRFFESQTPEFLGTIETLTTKGLLVRREAVSSGKSKQFGKLAPTYELAR